MKRVYNFSAGPSALPESVLKKAQAELLDYNGTGMSVMEMSHRSKDFQAILDDAKNNLRRLYNIPENYKIIFMQGGGTAQFACVAMNLLKDGTACYLDSGTWAHKAMEEAKKYGKVACVASTKDVNYTYLPDGHHLDLPEDCDYVYICKNNTVYGTEYHYEPDTKGHVLVADCSSDFLSEPLDVTKYGLIWAGAQKNAGIAGVTIVIVREDLLRDNLPSYVPTIFNYKLMAEKDSLYNTPPTYAIYIFGLVCQWLLEQGGLEGIKQRNMAKFNALYDYLDNQDFYTPRISLEHKDDRSHMNIDFTTPSEELDALFVQEAGKIGIKSIKGHRLIGGMRASCYNAMSYEGVCYLVDFMKKFASENK